MKKTQVAKKLIPAVALLCLTPLISSAEALILGVMIAVILGNPYLEITKVWTSKLLSWSVIGLGAGMNLMVVAKVGLEGIGYTFIGITWALILGLVLGKILKVEENTSILISGGTAICGGSAIAALAPTIRAKSHEISVSLGVVFLLNAVALVIFPMVGHWLNMTQHQFGLWSALAIHDTSSVVGAAMQFGDEALRVGTTTKLARALWIVPLTLIIGYFTAKRNHTDGQVKVKAKRPWFILGFLLMAALVTFVPALAEPGHYIEMVAKKALVLTLFLIGLGLSRESLKAVGPRALIQGLTLWILVAVSTLAAIQVGWIR